MELDTNRPPTTEMPVILDARPGKLNYVSWGLIPSHAAETPKFSTIYTRLETMASLPTYRHLIGKRHCVFVVEWFYDFNQKQTPSQRYFFQRKDRKILLLAGLWDTWTDKRHDIVIPSCTMSMQPSNLSIAGRYLV